MWLVNEMPYVKFSWLANLSRDVFDIAPKMRQHYVQPLRLMNACRRYQGKKIFLNLHINADHGSIPDYSNVLPSE